MRRAVSVLDLPPPAARRFSTLLRACLNYMPHNPEAFLVDYLRRRDPTTAQEVHISDRLEAIQTELNSIRNEGKMSRGGAGQRTPGCHPARKFVGEMKNYAALCNPGVSQDF